MATTQAPSNRKREQELPLSVQMMLETMDLHIDELSLPRTIEEMAYTAAMGNHIRKIRKAAGLSRLEFADLVEADMSLLVIVENGMSSPGAAKKILALAEQMLTPQ